MTRRMRLNEGNRRWWTLAAMCFALFMIMLDNTVVNVALPSIQEDLGATLSALEWTVNVYTLTFAVLLVTGGRLGDILGRRRMFLFGVVVFALSSAAIGLAPDQGWLVAGRAIQGVGAAFMMPATLSIITVTFPPEERGKAIGDLGRRVRARAGDRARRGRRAHRVRLLASDLLPQPAGGRRRRGGHAVRDARVARRDHRAPVDWPGIATLSVGLTALVLALIEGNSWGWGSPEVIGLLLTAPVGLGRLRPDRAARARADGRLLALPLARPSSARTWWPSSSRSRCSRCSSSSRSTCRTSWATPRSRRACASCPPR